MRITRSVSMIALSSVVAVTAAACGNSSLGGSSTPAPAPTSASSSESDSNSTAPVGGTLKIGFVTPITGPLAAFGEGDQWVVDQMTSYFADNPIKAGGTEYTIDVIVKDSQSDPKRAGEVAADLINNEGVDIVMAHATPETTVPVSDQCEANATPCITADTPWQPWFFGRNGDPAKGFEWTYHFFWGLEDIGAVFADMWDQVPTNKKVAGLYQNDADGNAFTDKTNGFPAIIGPQGYTLDVPGLTASGTQDYSAQIASYKKNGDELLTGIITPPDFATFLTQAKQQGFKPKLMTVGKAIEFPAAVDALGASAQNLATEVWWHPTYPTTSNVTGLTSQQFADAYTAETGKQWNMPLAFSESLFETMAAAVTAAGGPDKAAIAQAMKTMKVSTLVGTLDWGNGPVPNVAKTPLTGGQWRATSGGTFPNELVIVTNSHAKEMGLDVPLGGEVEPLS